jgi:hypothetical protein
MPPPPLFNNARQMARHVTPVGQHDGWVVLVHERVRHGAQQLRALMLGGGQAGRQCAHVGMRQRVLTTRALRVVSTQLNKAGACGAGWACGEVWLRVSRP